MYPPTWRTNCASAAIYKCATCHFSYRTLSIDTKADITTCSYHCHCGAALAQSAVPGFIEPALATSIDKRHRAALAARSNFAA
jgi:hypothetical protein